MGGGILCQLRASWQENGKGFHTDIIPRFIEQHGGTALYMHLGLDGEKRGKKTLCPGEVYAVFHGNGSTRFAFTLNDLALLGQAANASHRPKVQAHMKTQLALALADYVANKDLIHERRPLAPALKLAASR